MPNSRPPSGNRWTRRDDAAIREALFAWEINVFVCGQCDFRAQLPVGLLYVDKEKQLSVQYYPLDALGSEEFYGNFRRNGEPVEEAERKMAREC